MCNIFSGLIVTKKGKDWGKVLFLSGLHHEKDREQVQAKYGDETLAWESKEEYSLTSGFNFTHTVNVSAAEQKELLKLVEAWAKKQDKDKLLRSMITVTKDNKPTDDYQIMDNIIKVGDGYSLVADFAIHATGGHWSTLAGGHWSTLAGGYGSTLAGGYGSNLAGGDMSTLKGGDRSTLTGGHRSTLRGGYWSTLAGGEGSTLVGGHGSTLAGGDRSTCIVYGKYAYIVLHSRYVLLTMVWLDCGGQKHAVIDVDELFKKYKKGDKIEIVKGKVVRKVQATEPEDNKK